MKNYAATENVCICVFNVKAKAHSALQYSAGHKLHTFYYSA